MKYLGIILFHIVYMMTGRGDGDVSENEFVDKIMHRLEGHGRSVTTSLKNDSDWESFKSETFLQKVILRQIVAAKLSCLYVFIKVE